MFAHAHVMWKRQQTGCDPNDTNDDWNCDGEADQGLNWWFTPTGYAIRYAIVIVLFALILLYFIGGYTHAHRRMRRGQAPLRYHRWMARNRFASQYNHQYGHTQPSHGYPLETYAPPPPAYTSADAPPPTYQPPEGGTKVMPDQSYMRPPPLEERVGETSSSASLAAPPPAARS